MKCRATFERLAPHELSPALVVAGGSIIAVLMGAIIVLAALVAAR